MTDNVDFKCPDCGGIGKQFGLFPVYAPGTPAEKKRPYIEISCGFCEGTGIVVQADLDRRIEGDKMRAERLSRNMCLRDEAARLGICASELSRRERGYLNP